jgi:hypothetical protein
VPALPVLDRGDTPLSSRAIAGGGTADPDTVFELAKAHWTQGHGFQRPRNDTDSDLRAEMVSTLEEVRIRPHPFEFPRIRWLLLEAH